MKRPTFLTIWLVLLALGSVFTALTYGLGGAALQQALPVELPSWFSPLMLVLSVVELVGVWMLWQWKKMGFNLVVGVTVASALAMVLSTGLSSALTGIIFGAIGIGILYLAMKPVRSNFK